MRWIVTETEFLSAKGYIIPAGSLAYVDLDGYQWGFVTQSGDHFSSHVRDEAGEPVYGYDTHATVAAALTAVVKFTNR
jgi:hypothetical protein